MNVTVTNVNDAPVAVDDAKTVVEDSSANPVAVLANDADADNLSDPFNAGLRVIGKTDGSRCHVVIAADGLSVSYTPNEDFLAVTRSLTRSATTVPRAVPATSIRPR